MNELNDFSWIGVVFSVVQWVGANMIGTLVIIGVLGILILLVMSSLGLFKFSNLFGFGKVAKSTSKNSLHSLAEKGAEAVDNFFSGDNPLDPSVELVLKAKLYKKPNGQLYAESDFYLPDGTKQSELDAFEQVSQDLFIAHLPWSSLRGVEVSSVEAPTPTEIQKTNPATEKEISTLFPSNKNQNNRRG